MKNELNRRFRPLWDEKLAASLFRSPDRVSQILFGFAECPNLQKARSQVSQTEGIVWIDLQPRQKLVVRILALGLPSIAVDCRRLPSIAVEGPLCVTIPAF